MLSSRICSHWSRIRPNIISPSNIAHRNISLQLPEKYKGTRVEKWYLYWKNLIQDYRDVGRDTLVDMKKRPLRAAVIFSMLGAGVHCVRQCPDEASFRSQLLECEQDMALTSDSTRNPDSMAYLRTLETLHNEGRLRVLRLGLCALLWRADYEKGCGLFEAKCGYTSPSILDFHTRILDVGALGRWWLLERAMTDFDVNPEEWSAQASQ